MPVFSYRAVNPDSAVVRGSIAADTPRQARDLLRSGGLTVQEVVQVRESFGPSLWQRWLAARNAGKVVSTIRELATLLAVGIRLLEALEAIALQHRGSFRTAMLLLRDRVSAGTSLSDAMQEQPMLFDPICINMVQVGEASGALDEVLEQLADFKERAAQFKGHIASALMYPGIVLTMAIGVTIFLMTFVIPNLLANLEHAGQELPATTLAIKAMSDFFVHYWWAIIGGVVGLALIIGVALQSTAIRRRWHRIQLGLPILGDMIRKQAISRIAFVVSTLLRSGIVFVQAVRIAKHASSNLVLRDGLTACEEAVERGEEISVSLARTNSFPPLVVQIFALGQQSGRLEEMLGRLARDYDRQVAGMAQRLSSVLEPVLIVLVASFVGFVALATILPILEASNVS